MLEFVTPGGESWRWRQCEIITSNIVPTAGRLCIQTLLREQNKQLWLLATSIFKNMHKYPDKGCCSQNFTSELCPHAHPTWPWRTASPEGWSAVTSPENLKDWPTMAWLLQQVVWRIRTRPVHLSGCWGPTPGNISLGPRTEHSNRIWLRPACSGSVCCTSGVLPSRGIQGLNLSCTKWINSLSGGNHCFTVHCWSKSISTCANAFAFWCREKERNREDIEYHHKGLFTKDTQLSYFF